MKKIFILFVCFISTSVLFAAGPVIDVWYGNVQNFGQRGNPQPWVNILGNVSDTDGVKELKYTLNGGAEIILSLGPDGRRLQNKGDFNIDIAVKDLSDGSNTVTIYALDSLDESNSEVVTLNYTSGQVWPDEYSFEWDTVTNMQNVVQVVDGKWELTGNGIRTTETGYDRLIAIGDTSWTNYEIEIPITIHDLEAPISEFGGNDFGLGLIMRWTGHTDTPVEGWQPKSGFLPLGEIGWFNWPKFNTSNTQLNFFHITNSNRNPFTVLNGNTYIFKFQVYTTPNEGHRYRLKVWEDGTAEPIEWFLDNTRALSELSIGSLLFVAHHVDATFGNPKVRNLPEGPLLLADFTNTISETNPLQVSFDASASFDKDGTITDFSWDFGDENTASGQMVNHEFGETGTYTVTLEITDESGETISVSKIIYVDETGASFISEDFNKKELDPAIWSFQDPIGDGSYSIDGYNTGNSIVKLNVPGGTAHDIWTNGNESVRLLQKTVDKDFEIEAKFESIVSQTNQIQGILVEEDDENFIRFDFYSQNNEVRAFCATFNNGTPEIKYNASLSLTSDQLNELYLRILREENSWTMFYSTTGDSWQELVTFSFDLIVSNTGIFGANAGSTPSAHVVKVDYYFDTLNPVIPEDGLGVRITEATDEGIECYKIETLSAIYYFDKSGGGLTSMIDDDGNDWISFSNGGGSAGEYRGIPNSGELHPGYTGGSSSTQDEFNTWLDDATIETTRNGESATWTFYPTHGKMILNQIGGDDGKYWVLYEGTPGGAVGEDDTLHLSNGAKYSANEDNPFGSNDITNPSGIATGSEWVYFTDGSLDRSIYLAISDDNVRDNYYQMEDNMTVMGFGRGENSIVQHRTDEGAILVFGIAESKNKSKVEATIDTAWKSSQNKIPVADFTVTVDAENPLLIHFDASGSTDLDGQITSYEWIFGDQTTGTGQVLSHTYPGDGNYTVKLIVTDNYGDTSSVSNTILVTSSDLAFESDDFSSTELDTEIWEFLNPATDGSYSLVDENGSAVIKLEVPSGKRHEIWEKVFTPVGIIQDCKNIDFELEAKFESTVSERFQEQGVLIMDNQDRLLRIEVFSDGTDQFFFVAKLENGTPTILENKVIEFTNDIFFKVSRTLNSWNIEYSTNGLIWNSGTSFDFILNVKKVGAYGGNAGNNPAHTAKLDYFFNNANRIDPEDPNSKPITSIDDELISELIIYPNPSNTDFHVSYSIESKSVVEIALINAKGQVIRNSISNQAEGQYDMLQPVMGLSKGLYFLRININNSKTTKTITKKLIIE